VNENGKIISERLKTHFDIVKQYGGVFPDQMAKCHQYAIHEIIEHVLNESKHCMEGEIDAVAVTCGPGLHPCLKVGIQAAKKMCNEMKKPIIAINHLEAHLLSARMFSKDITFPYLTLLVSGGHCLLVHANSLGEYKILVSTKDDSIGEAFDKIARLLDIEYGNNEFSNAGSALEHKASQFVNLSTDIKQEHNVRFTVPLRNRRKGDLEYSFSGLKSNVLRYVRLLEMKKEDNKLLLNELMCKNNLSRDTVLSEEQKICIAHEFQDVAFTHLLEKTELAFNKHRLDEIKHFVICGGVAANKVLRERLQDLCDKYNLILHTPPAKYCTDNAAMVAWAGIVRFQYSDKLLQESIESIDLRGRWSLTSLSSTRNFVPDT
jgi:N6-L-threonylcarbamoyladenine synthase